MLLRNVSPRGDLDVPLIRRIVLSGDTAEVSEDQARRLLDQPDNFQPADMDAENLLRAMQVELREAEEAANETEAGQ